MKTQRQMWQEINEPKVEKCIPIFDENRNPLTVAYIVDRIPRIRRNRK